jgi:uncharacterized PurR-regulated membrane protein YhhQ (DUF165 family)
LIAFKLGQGWSYQRVLAIGLVNYAYKAVVAMLLTPLIYLIENRIRLYLGADTVYEMKQAAMKQD